MKNLTYILFTVLFSINYSMGQDPTISSFDTHVLCPDGGAPQMAISNIVFNSPNGDSTYITSVFFPTTAFNLDVLQNESSASHILLGTIVGGATGVFNIEVYYQSVSSSILSETIQVTVAEIPNISVNTASICNNLNEFDLNTLVNIQGGGFEITPGEFFLDNGLINVQGFVEDNPNDTSFLYKYEYIDEFGCMYTSNMTAVTLKNSPKISLQSLTNTVCNDNLGEIKTSVDSPNGSYNGYWSNGAQNINTISSLTAGDYYQTVIDQIGCKDQIAVVVETDGFEISGNVSHVKCKGGSDGEIDINISSGSGNYKIIWSSGQSTTSVSGLSAGTYSVKVTDLDNGCESYKNFVVEEPLEEVLAYYINNRPSTCSASDGEIIDVDIINGNPPYSFIWSNGETTEEISGLSSGHYSVEITDGLGCKATYKTNLNALGAPNASPKLTNPSCGESNGAIQLIEVYPKFGEEVIGYLWSNGMETRNINNLNTGVYTITLKQSDGCNGIYSYELKAKPYNYAPEICIVSVDTATNTNLVVWEKEHGNPNDIAHYNIYRANSTTGEYQNVGLVDYTSISVFNDVVVSPERRSWQYKISAVNSCGQESRLSQHHKTIHLVMNDGQFQGEKTLTWDHYEGLEYFYYNLYRGTDIDGWQLVQGNISISTLPFFEDIIPTGASGVDYIVEVVPTNGGCTATYTKAQDYNSSRSNKPSPIFNPGHGTGDPSNSLMVIDKTGFKAIVYPNPSNGDFKIDIIENVNNESLNMTVLGLNGKTIHQQSLKNNLNTLNLNMEAGIYFIQIQGNSTHETIRIVIQ